MNTGYETWADIIRNADDVDADYKEGVARRGTSTYIRLGDRTIRCDHTDMEESIDVFIELVKIYSEYMSRQT